MTSAKSAAIVLAACLLAPGIACAQTAPTLLDSYGRAIELVDYMTSFVGESLLACAAKNVLTEEQAETRYQAYRKRNAALLERAEAWNQGAERRLQAQGEERAAQRLAEDKSLTAMANASARAGNAIGKAADARAACTAMMAAIESGRFDLAVNAELVNLLKTNP